VGEDCEPSQKISNRGIAMTEEIKSVPQPFPDNVCPACERGERSLTPPPTSIFPKPVPVHNPSGNVCAKFINPEMLKALGDFHAKW
jgi:hypothetical protein